MSIRENKHIMMMITSSHLLQHIKFAREAVPETICLRDQIVCDEILLSEEVATRRWEILESQCYEV